MKIISNKKYLYIFAFTLWAIPFSAGAENKKDELIDRFPSFNTKACQIKYKSEVSAITKLVDSSKAKKKIVEIQTLRKEQDKNIKNIFARIEITADTEDKKIIVDEHKDEVLKIIEERRDKIDELQSSIQITSKDVENIVRATLLEQSTSTVKICPLQVDTQKDIRNTNKAKLKKLVTDKTESYLLQTKEIQQDFLSEIKNSLTDLSLDLNK